LEKIPGDTVTLKAIGKELDGYQFRIQLSPLDCTGCGNCTRNCPAGLGILRIATEISHE